MKTHMQCQWMKPTLRAQLGAGGSDMEQCPKEGLWIAVYGCLNMHIGEGIFCSYHWDDWEELADETGLKCQTEDCEDYIQLWEKAPVSKLTVKYVVQMARK